MLKQTGYSKALGNIHTLQAPFFENYIKPESVAEALTVKATIYFYNCLYDRADEAHQRVQRGLPARWSGELKKLVDRAPPTTRAFFEVRASRSARARRACPSRSSAPRAASSPT